MIQTLHPSNFTIHPLDNLNEEQILFFSGMVRDFELNMHKKLLSIRVRQSEDDSLLSIIWKILATKTNFQLNCYSTRNDSAFSVIFLECETQDHWFSMSCEPTQDAISCHELSLSYRAHIRFGPNGNMSGTSDDDASVSDRILAKLIFKSPTSLR